MLTVIVSFLFFGLGYCVCWILHNTHDDNRRPLKPEYDKPEDL